MIYDIQIVLKWFASAFYLLSAGLFIVYFSGQREAVGKIARSSIIIGLASQTFFLGLRSISAMHIPLGSSAEAMSVCAWMIAVAYLYLESRTDVKAMGTFIVPFVAFLSLIGAATMTERSILKPILRSMWFGVHVSTSLLAYASFAISCVSALMYVFLSHEIQAKRLGFFYSRLPSLDDLDHLNYRAVRTGFILLTMGIILGSIWASQAWGAFWKWDPKLTATLITWVIYGVNLNTRILIGWQGRKVAYLSILGFGLVLCTFFVAARLPGVHMF